LSVGELNTNKNHRTLIRALERMGDSGNHYIICGKGDRLEDLKKQAEKAGLDANVHFLGYRQDISAICRHVDAFAMPSFREGLPVASLEAMYVGVPIVASRIRGLTDIVEDGKSGFLCESDDVNAFAQAIEELKSNSALRQRMAERGREIAIPYCISNTKKEVLELIKTCI
ncbi:MAG: glycosyltransferase, partial [Prevotella sp.]|nr:glycosyltransferase [Prevotella sp.]